MVKREGMVWKASGSTIDERKQEVMRYVDGAQRGWGSWIAATELGKKKDKIRTKALYDKIKAWWTGD